MTKKFLKLNDMYCFRFDVNLASYNIWIDFFYTFIPLFKKFMKTCYVLK